MLNLSAVLYFSQYVCLIMTPPLAYCILQAIPNYEEKIIDKVTQLYAVHK
jgi:hypothetical protein